MYTNQVEGTKEQRKRTPKGFPSITIDESIGDADGFTIDHVTSH